MKPAAIIIGCQNVSLLSFAVSAISLAISARILSSCKVFLVLLILLPHLRIHDLPECKPTVYYGYILYLFQARLPFLSAHPAFPSSLMPVANENIYRINNAVGYPYTPINHGLTATHADLLSRLRGG